MKVLEMSVECKLIAFCFLNYFNRDIYDINQEMMATREVMEHC